VPTPRLFDHRNSHAEQSHAEQSGIDAMCREPSFSGARHDPSKFSEKADIDLPKFYRFERLHCPTGPPGVVIHRGHPRSPPQQEVLHALRPSLILKPPTSAYVDRVRMVATGIMAGLDQGQTSVCE